MTGRAKFSRSGRATVLKGKSYVDITVTGGLTSRSMVHATLQTYRAGVAVAAVRINYPTAGKARIYLTKVASTTSSTYVAWFVARVLGHAGCRVSRERLSPRSPGPPALTSCLTDRQGRRAAGMEGRPPRKPGRSF